MSKIVNAQARGRDALQYSLSYRPGTKNPFSNDSSKQTSSLIWKISTNASKLVHQKISEQRQSVPKLLHLTEYSCRLQCKIWKLLGPHPQNFRVTQLQLKIAAHIRDGQWGNLSYPPS